MCSYLCIRISKKECDQLLDDGYHSSQPISDSDRFGREWRDAWRAVKSNVEEDWKHADAGGPGDFFMPEDPESTRMLSVEIGNIAMLDRNLLQKAHQCITNLDGDFCVDFCNDWMYLELAPGIRHPHFNVFVSKNGIAFILRATSS